MATVIYRPNGVGTNTNIEYSNPATGEAHWEDVDDVSSDGNDTYVMTTSGSYVLDTYNFANPSESGAINSVTIYGVCKTYYGTGTGYAKLAIYAGGAAYYGSEETLSGSWTEYSKQWATNPATSSDWTWSDLNSLEIGIALKGATDLPMCTQIYVVIDYTPDCGGLGIGQPFIF